MSTHHHYSPSKLRNLNACGCYEQDENETNDAAEAGTRQHLAVETGDLTPLQNKWEHERVLECQMVEQGLVAEFPNAEVIKELRVGGIFNHGSSDLNLLDYEAGVAVILDWKMGKIDVEPVARNIQIWNYVLNMFTMYTEINTIHGCIFQPQVSSDIQRHVFTRADIPRIETRIRLVIERAEDPNTEPTPDSSACTYCNKKAKHCKPWQGIAKDAMNEEYGLTLPPTFMSIVDLPAEHVGNYYKCMQVLEDFAARGKKAALERTDQIKQVTGEYPEGVGVVSRKGNLKCVWPSAVGDDAARIGQDKFMTECVTVKASKLVAALNAVTGEPADVIAERYIEQGVFERGNDVRYVKVKGTKAKALEVLKGVK